MTSVLRARGLRVSFRSGPSIVKALDGVDLDAGSGDLIFVRGVSGCGKSTLVNVCSGILQPDAGSVSVLGHDVSSMSEQERSAFRLEHVGLIFQSDMLIDEFDAVENVAFPLELLGTSRSQSMEAAAEALAIFGVDELSRRFPPDMSGGQRQRVAIARCFVGSKPLILADEPTASLDSANADADFRALRRAADHGRSVLIVSHDHRAEAFADTVVEMLDGRIVEKRPPCT